jgi:lipopolysaccharide transport system permease protein
MNNLFEAVSYCWSTRRAWWFLASAKTRERFARTTLGSFWLGISNLLSVVVLGVIYGTVFEVERFGEYFVYLGIGLTLWNTISGAVMNSQGIFKSCASRIKNTSQHPIFYTMEEWAFQLQTFAQSLAVVILVLTVFQPNIALHVLTVGILPLANIVLFIWWAPVMLAVIGSRFEDFHQLIPVAVQILFLVSPILYQREALGKWGWTADINVMYRMVSNARHAMITGELKITQVMLLLAANLFCSALTILTLERQRRKLPFLI